MPISAQFATPPTLRVSARRGIVAALASFALAATSLSQTYSNSNPILIPDFSPATPYPSSINVSNAPPMIGSISVTIQNFVHTFPGDVCFVLVAPDGRAINLSRRCGGTTNANGGVFTFLASDLAPPVTTFGAPSASFAATVCQPGTTPGAPTPTITDLVDFTGSNPNGTWSLYVFDEAAGDSGAIQGGWSITFTPVAPISAPTPTTFIYQGQLTQDDQPLSGNVTARIRLFNQESGGIAISPPLILDVPVNNGLLNIPIDLPPEQINPGTPLWLALSINGTPLEPRTRIAPAPLATKAAVATTAQAVPWSGITGIPANISGLRWNTGSIANSSWSAGPIGIGSQPLPSSRLLLHQPALLPTQWHMEMINVAAPNFRGGIRLNDSGFVEVSNLATNEVSFFARLNSTGAWTVASDARLKTDVRPAFGMLDTAMKLRPVFFHWLSEDAGQEDFGLIAQDVRDVLPRLVTGDESKDTLTVNYAQLSVVAIAAIQELKARHEAELAAVTDALSARIEAQEKQLLQQSSQIEDLIRRLDEMDRQGQSK